MNSPQPSATTETRQCATHGAYESRALDGLERRTWSACAMCQADEADRRKAREDAESARRAEARRHELLSDSAIPSRYRECSLEKFTTSSEAQVSALRIATRLKKSIVTEPGAGYGLILCGNVGTGKTHIACGIALAVIDANRTARYETVLTAMRGIKATYNRNSELTEQEAIDQLIAPDLLVLDEVGVQMGTEHEKTLLFEVLNERYQWKRSTILISNLSGDALTEYLGERCMDRFRQTGAIVPFTWESQRGKAR